MFMRCGCCVCCVCSERVAVCDGMIFEEEYRISVAKNSFKLMCYTEYINKIEFNLIDKMRGLVGSIEDMGNECMKCVHFFDCCCCCVDWMQIYSKIYLHLRNLAGVLWTVCNQFELWGVVVFFSLKTNGIPV